MGHLDDGVLRRLYDEPAAVPTADQAHLAACAACTARFAAIQADADFATALFAAAPARRPTDRPLTANSGSKRSGNNTTVALARVRLQVQAETPPARSTTKNRDQSVGRISMYVAAPRRRLASPLGAFALAAAVIGAAEPAESVGLWQHVGW
jgi:hypothetical protein